MPQLKDRIASGTGSILEWYDFSLYGFFAPLLAQIYFPTENPMVGMLATFSAFAIGFIARPIGALLFGYISDRYGRAFSLKLTPMLITIPTLLMAFLPSYQAIGIFAPIILILLRIIQGICIGGEYANNLIYLCESARPKCLYFLGSLGSCTGSIGILLASSIASLCYFFFSADVLLQWGWRLAFGISLIIGVIAFWMRKTIAESPRFDKILKEKRIVDNPVWISYKTQFNDYVLALGLIFLPATSFYFIFMFLPNYMSSYLAIDPAKATGENSLTLASRLLIIPIIGLLADKIGGIKIARLAAILLMVVPIPLFYVMIHYKDFAFYALYALGIITTLNAATTPGLLVELLKPETRCTIFSFTFNVGFGVFGGIVPLVSFWIADVVADPIVPVYYLVGAAVITFVASFYFDKRTVRYV